MDEPACPKCGGPMRTAEPGGEMAAATTTRGRLELHYVCRDPVCTGTAQLSLPRLSDDGDDVDSGENYLRAAHIVAEDDDTMVVEVRKAGDAPPDLDENEDWVMLVFVRAAEQAAEPFLPWAT